jgi:hypothetical protein
VNDDNMKTIAIRGSAYAVGQQLGAFGREAWHTKIRQTALWQTVTALKTAEQTQRMRAAVQAQWPHLAGAGGHGGGAAGAGG